MKCWKVLITTEKIKEMGFYLKIFALTILAASCTKKSVRSEADLKAFVLDPGNGLMQIDSTRGVVVQTTFKPNDLIIAQQLYGIDDMQERERTRKNFDTLMFFVLQFSRKGQEIENAYVSDDQRFQQVTRYLSHGIRDNIYLVTSRDTLMPLDVAYTRMFGAANATSVMPVFDISVAEINGPITLILEDNVLEVGHLSFEFDADKIKNVPTLNSH